MIDEIIAATTFLCDSAAGEGPIREILNAIIWLDPVWFMNEEDTDNVTMNEDEEANIQWAAWTMRDCFPDLYAEIVTMNAGDVSYREMETRIMSGVERRTGLDVGYGIDELRMGIPLNSFAFNDDVELGPTSSDPAVNFASWLIDAEGLEGLKVSLRACKETVYQDLLTLINWMQGGTGNSMADFTLEEIYEYGYEPLHWTPEDVAFTIEMLDEAEEIYHTAHEMLTRLTSDTYLRKQVVRNIWRAKNGYCESDGFFWGYGTSGSRAAYPAGNTNVLPSWANAAASYQKRRDDRISRVTRSARQPARRASGVYHRPAASQHALGRTVRHSSQDRVLSPAAGYRAVAGRIGRTGTHPSARTGHVSRYQQRRIAALLHSRGQRTSRQPELRVVSRPAAQYGSQRHLLGNRRRAA